MNPNVREFKIGDSVLMDRGHDKIHILDIKDYEGCTVLIYKVWNKFRKMWDYAGQKYTEILYWNSLIWGLDKEERNELFRLNGFDWDEVKGY